jgi:hypothetical protein
MALGQDTNALVTLFDALAHGKSRADVAALASAAYTIIRNCQKFTGTNCTAGIPATVVSSKPTKAWKVMTKWYWLVSCDNTVDHAYVAGF